MTGRGLARYRKNAFEAVETRTGGLDLLALSVGADGRVYLGIDRGLISAAPPLEGRVPEFSPESNAPRQQVNGILAEPGGTIWFSCGLKLCRLERGQLRVFEEADGLPPERWGLMLRDRAGNLWVRGPRRLFVQPRGEARFQARDRNLLQSSNSALSMIEDRLGRLLVSTDRGVAQWAGGRAALGNDRHRTGAQSETATALLEDREGSIWIGLWGSGVVRWPGSPEWTNWTSADGLANDLVWAVGLRPSRRHRLVRQY